MPFPLFRAPAALACVDNSGFCKSCGGSATVRFSGTCYVCFRKGEAHQVIGTELGMVRPEDAKVGLTHGIPLNDPTDLEGYELVPHPIDPDFPDESWFHVRIASELLLELTRTPAYLTWQGEHWQFCCKRPSMFLGSVPDHVLSRNAPSIREAIADWFRCPRWDSIVRSDYSSITYHVFQCPNCNSFRYHEDID
jgi:uncharacterized protein CbrC (UPF0167 family)